MKLGIICVIIFAIFSLLINCKKKETPTPLGSPAPPLQSYSIGKLGYYEYILNDIVSIASVVSEFGSLGIYNSVSSCATVSILSNSIIVDFGFSNCPCKDLQIRRGKLIFDFSNSTNNATSFRMPGFNLNVSSDGWGYLEYGRYVNINKMKITNISPLSVIGQTVYTGNDLVWSDSSNVIVKWIYDIDTVIGTRTIKLLNSSDTSCYNGQGKPLKWAMAKIQIDGASKGRITAKDAQNATVYRPFNSNVSILQRDFRCTPSSNVSYYNPFISGTLDFTTDSIKTERYDYGNGVCDHQWPTWSIH